MGARQSKRSVDITTTPKKEGLPVEGVVGDAAAPGDGKLEKIEETDAKPTTNGVAPHTDATPEDKDKDKDEATEKENEKDDETKTEEVKVESPTTENPAEGAVEVTTPTEGTPASPTTATSPDSKETKKKDKLKKKWSFRSISFGKKDKNKPAREDTPKNGDVTKEEPLAEGGEEAETAEAAATSPTDEKSAVSSPTEKEQNAVVAETPATESVPAEEKKTTIVATPSPVDESKDETSSPVPIPVPVVEAKKIEEIEKSCEPAIVEKKVEVSQVSTVIEASPIEANSQSKQKSTVSTTAASIIERKTSEDIPSQFPSSPPPTPIDPSPLQKAQQVAANATALAEALKLPAEAANKANVTYASGKSTIFATSPSSILPNEMPSDTKTPIDQNHEKPISSNSFPEQTGKISPIPIVISTITTAVMETIEKSSSLLEKNQLPVTEKINDLPENLEKLSTINEKTQLPVTEKIINVCDDIVKNSDISIETIKSEMPRDNDLVIQTEEGPMLISDIIIVEAKPAIVVPDSPIGNTVQVLLEPENNHDSVESVKEIVESREGLLVDLEDKNEVVQTLSEPIVPVAVSKVTNEEITEKDVPPPLPDSPIPVPKVTSQLLNFISTQIEDSSVIPEIIDTTTKQSIGMNLINTAEDVPTPEVPETIEPSEMSEDTDEIQATAMRMEAMNLLMSAEDVPTPQVLQTVDLSEIIEDTNKSQGTTMQMRARDLIMSAEDVPTPQVIQKVDPQEISEDIKNLEATDESHSHADEQRESSNSLPPPEEFPDSQLDRLSRTIDDSNLSPVAQEINKDVLPPIVTFEENHETTENTKNSKISDLTPNLETSISQIPMETSLPTPPRSPIDNHDDLPTKKSSSLLELSDEPSNREFKMESVDQSLNSYNDSELELKERLAESMEENTTLVNGQLTLKNVQDNDQSKTEVEAPVENNVIQNDIGTTEANDEAPKSPPPAVPAEAPAPILGPAITEDVASVTKAIEEIDINEKAVAAAVNENIESINTNEIIADMNHQNNMNE